MNFDETKINGLREWAKGKNAPPMTIELIPTDKCNSKCLTCWRRGFTSEQLQERYKAEMSDDRLLKLIDEAAKLGVKEIAFVGGGEPLIREVTFQLMQKIKKRGMIGDLVTNGTLFKNEVIKNLVKIGWDRIKFSVDGADASTHNHLRGIESFETVVKNVKAFLDLKKKLGVEKPRLIFNTVISNINYKSLPDLVKLANKIGIEEILLLPLTVFEESIKNMKLNEEETREFQSILKKSIKIAKRLRIENNFQNFLEAKYLDKTDRMDEVMMEELGKESEVTGEELEILKEKVKGKNGFLSSKIEKEYPKAEDPVENFKFLPCFDSWHHITIIANGNIAPCFSPWVWDTKTTIKDHSLEELWYGPYFEKFRDIMLTRKLPENCQTCCVWKVFENRKIRKQIEDYEKFKF